MKNIKTAPLVMILALSIAVSCNQKTNTEANQTDKAIESFQSFGESITESNTTPMDNAIELLKATDTLDIKLTGRILKTCKAKGCWMEVDMGNGEAMRVTFKDYGFFVPKNGVEGKTVIFQGKAINTVTSIEDLKHFAKDGGASEEELNEITQPKREVSFVAQGVLIKS